MDIKSMFPDELKKYVKEMGMPEFRAKQIFKWLHEKRVLSADEMTNLPKDLREVVGKSLTKGLEEEKRQVSKKDGTVKFLFKLHDGQMIESVFMPYKHGNSICISSQAGCRMGCSFCASTIGGLVRNLTASEMLEQVYSAMRITGEKISNVVVMGTGEPLDNYDNLIRFIKLITDKEGFNLSMRNITVSSCGLVPQIYALADEGLTITFALSLHAPNDEKRRKLMPVANRYTIRETLDACKYYFNKTGRRVTLEYALVSGENDGEIQAEELAKLIKGYGFHVNLIPVNPINERNFQRSDKNSVEKFKSTLENYRINVTIRRGMGSDIDAACGQLRRKYETLKSI